MNFKVGDIIKYSPDQKEELTGPDSKEPEYGFVTRVDKKLLWVHWFYYDRAWEYPLKSRSVKFFKVITR